MRALPGTKEELLGEGSFGRSLRESSAAERPEPQPVIEGLVGAKRGGFFLPGTIHWLLKIRAWVGVTDEWSVPEASYL